MIARSSALAGNAVRMGRFIWQAAPGRATATLVLMLLSTVTDSVSILLLLPFLNLLAKNGSADQISIHLPTIVGPAEELHVGLLTVLLMFVTMIAVSSYLNRLKSLLMADMLLDILNALRAGLFQSIAQSKWSFVSGQRLADFDHALTGDIDRVQSAMTNLILFIQNAILVLVFVGVSCLVSVYVTILVSLLGGLLLLFMAPFRARATAFGEGVTADRRRQYRATSDFLLGLKVAKSFNAQSQYQDRFVAALQNLKINTLSFVKLNSLASFLFQLSTAIAASVFIYASLEFLALGASQIIVLVVIFSRISPRLSALQSFMQVFATNYSAFRSMQDVQYLATEAREFPGLGPLVEPSFDMSIELRAITFGYGERQIFENLSFTINQRQITALVGPSGSGKSTLADLLLGLQFPSRGEILIDGIALGSIDLEAWRAHHVSYVQQDTFLFAGTLADNLRLADPTASDEMVWDALRMAHAAAFVERLPEGINTAVGDGAIQFSGGERQRLSIARAVIRRPSLLILDEATSGLDATNTELIADLLRQLGQEMAIVVITHEEGVAAIADQTIRLGANSDGDSRGSAVSQHLTLRSGGV